ncbi:velvet factor [Chlamydoabsidia padenii]|nr:velvet factor [Chlamydoabsidia padenii]
MYVGLVSPANDQEIYRSTKVLSGQIASSMYKLKDITDQDDGFFCFGDLSCRMEGEFRLRFSLFEIVSDGAVKLMQTTSDVFKVYSSKTMPRSLDATFLSRSFSDQGVRIRIRKEHRVQT